MAAGAHSRNETPSAVSFGAELARIHAAPAKASTERGGALISAPAAKIGAGLLGLGRVQDLLPALVFRHFRQCERDLFGGGVQHDKDRRLPLFHRSQHIGEEPAVREFPVRLRHLVGGRRQPQHAVGAVRAPPVEPALAADLREAPPQLGEVADEIGEVVASLPRLLPADPADLVVLAIGVVVAGLRVADLVAGEDQRHALRQQQAGERVLAQLPAQRDDRRDRRSGPHGRNCCCDCRWSRRDCPRRWPRCASRCS